MDEIPVNDSIGAQTGAITPALPADPNAPALVSAPVLEQPDVHWQNIIWAKMDPTPVDAFLQHDMNPKKGNMSGARVARGLQAMIGGLKLAIVDVFLGGLGLLAGGVKDLRKAPPEPNLGELE